jgi:hypothetical protein
MVGVNEASQMKTDKCVNNCTCLLRKVRMGKEGNLCSIIGMKTLLEP